MSTDLIDGMMVVLLPWLLLHTRNVVTTPACRKPPDSDKRSFRVPPSEWGLWSSLVDVLRYVLALGGIHIHYC